MALTIDKVYIDGPFDSKILAGVFLASFERVSHLTYFIQHDSTIPTCDPLSVLLSPGFFQCQCCSTKGPGNFLITKIIWLLVYLSISLRATHMHRIHIYYRRNGSDRRIRSVWPKSHRRNGTRDEHKQLDQIHEKQICSYFLKEHLIFLQFF